MRSSLYFGLLACFFAFGLPQFVQAQSAAWRITPGKSIGQVNIGAPASSLSVLGPAQGGDAAMGKAWNFWYSKGKDNKVDSARYLAVYTALDSTDTVHIQQVRVNSSSYKTANGVKVGSALANVRLNYPGIRQVAVYVSKTNPRKRLTIYDDIKKGIAFEIGTSSGLSPSCTAITVHTPGDQVTDVYLALPEYQDMNKVQ